MSRTESPSAVRKKEATKCASKPASSAQCSCGRCATVLALTRRRRFSRTDAISDDDVADDAEWRRWSRWRIFVADVSSSSQSWRRRSVTMRQHCRAVWGVFTPLCCRPRAMRSLPFLYGTCAETVAQRMSNLPQPNYDGAACVCLTKGQLNNIISRNSDSRTVFWRLTFLCLLTLTLYVYLLSY